MFFGYLSTKKLVLACVVNYLRYNETIKKNIPIETLNFVFIQCLYCRWNIESLVVCPCPLQKLEDLIVLMLFKLNLNDDCQRHRVNVTFVVSVIHI